MLGAQALPVNMETEIARGQGGLAEGSLSAEEAAARQPSFWDTLGTDVAAGIGEGVGTLIGGSRNRK